MTRVKEGYVRNFIIFLLLSVVLGTSVECHNLKVCAVSCGLIRISDGREAVL